MRGAVLTVVTAGLVTAVGASTVLDGVALGAALWVGFPLALLGGSVFPERVPATLAAVHAGDWPLELVAVGGLLGAVA